MQSEVTLHAKLSPSSSDIWLNCAGSLLDQPEDKGSQYAAEGTAAHALCEHCLINNINADVAPSRIEWDRFDSPEMRGYVQEYLDYVRRHIGNGELFVEQKLQIHPVYGVWGTADAIIVGRDGVIHLADFKYGQGVLVDPDSTQLLLYAIGAADGFSWFGEVDIHTVTVHVVQPRRSNIVSKSYSVEELNTWSRENEARMARAASGIAQFAAGAHCKWCRKRATCAERREFIKVSAAMDFADGCKPEVHDKDEEELVRIFKNIPLIQQYLKDIETWVADKSHEQGHALVGLKYVQGRGVRVITDPDGAAKVLREIGVEPFGEPKLLGITEIEKRLKGIGVKLGDVLGKFVEIKTSDPVLVGEADKRPAYDPTSGAKEDFA